MYLLDTDTCIRFLRGETSVMAKVCSRSCDEVIVSIPTIYELEVGLAKATINVQRKRQTFDKMLELLTVANFGLREVKEAARIRAELEKKGTPIGSIDYLIAGIALSHRWMLVTGNTKEFKRVKGLKIEMW